MPTTSYPDINEVLDHLLSQIKAVLTQKLVGVYLYGSLVWGDFEYQSSDIDLLVAISSEIDEQEFRNVDQMHRDVVERYTQWNNRIEIAYISLHALQTFKLHSSQIAIISPGEPFHIKDAGTDWLVNWYLVQEKGTALFGPSPRTIIAPISKAEFIQAVQQQAKDWREYIVHTQHSRPYQAYAILTLCRALYAATHGEQVSKRQAALWAETHVPAWATLIRNARAWRAAWRDQAVDHAATFPETRRFVEYMIDRINPV